MSDHVVYIRWCVCMMRFHIVILSWFGLSWWTWLSSYRRHEGLTGVYMMNMIMMNIIMTCDGVIVDIMTRTCMMSIIIMMMTRDQRHGINSHGLLYMIVLSRWLHAWSDNDQNYHEQLCMHLLWCSGRIQVELMKSRFSRPNSTRYRGVPHPCSL